MYTATNKWTHLRAVAYRMLGSLSEADDAPQEAWLRLGRSDARGVENLGGWLTTVVARVCLDFLRSRKSRREVPLDVYVPDPIVSRADEIDAGGGCLRRTGCEGLRVFCRFARASALPPVNLCARRSAPPPHGMHFRQFASDTSAGVSNGHRCIRGTAGR